MIDQQNISSIGESGENQTLLLSKQPDRFGAFQSLTTSLLGLPADNICDSRSNENDDSVRDMPYLRRRPVPDYMLNLQKGLKTK